ncbi:MAG: hypothetical protein Q7S18_00345 [bacterium]|nr:hypothetical protein [bacterium]
MKKIFKIALVIAMLTTASIVFAKANVATIQNLKQAREEMRTQRQTTLTSLQQEKQQWKTQRQETLDNVKQQKEELKAMKEKFTAEKCAKIQEKVQNRTSEFNSEKEKHLSVYANLVNRINKFVARFADKKLDTSTIKSHLAELQTKIDKFKEDYAAYIAKLGESKNLTCGHSEGEFKGTLLEAKTLLQTVHSDAADIRTYVRTVILADIKNLKAQSLQEEKNTSDSSKTDDAVKKPE